MPSFTFTGDFDEVSAKLKATFEASDANFNANLDALFNPAPPKKPVAPAAPASTANTSAEWSLGTNRPSSRDVAASYSGLPNAKTRVTR